MGLVVHPKLLADVGAARCTVLSFERCTLVAGADMDVQSSDAAWSHRCRQVLAQWSMPLPNVVRY